MRQIVRTVTRAIGVLTLCAIAGAVAGVASWALFEALDTATDWRLEHDWLVWTLPAAALALGAAYHWFGGEANRGTSLVIARTRPPVDGSVDGPVPARMAPMIFGATWVAQLTGASVGREGAAIQVAGSLVNTLVRPLRLSVDTVRVVLLAAIAGSFGGAFGVPVAGAIFALEVHRTGRLGYESLLPVLAASVTADLVVEGLGRSTPLESLPVDLDPWVVIRVVVIGLAAGVAARMFIVSLGVVKRMAARVAWVPARPVIGAVATLALMTLVGRDYLGLSLPLVDDALAGGAADWWDPVLKIVFTVVALGCSIPGGEVTPLFVVGATLGSTLAAPLDLDPRLAAATCLAAVFGAAANAPMACAVLAVELFGAGLAVPAACACVVAYTVSPEHGIYDSRRQVTTTDPRATAAPRPRP